MEFLTYKTLSEQDQAKAVAEILKTNGIEFQVTTDRSSLDSLYGGDKPFNTQFFIKIRKEDFSKADSILLNASEEVVSSIDKDYHLYSFTDEELFDILSKPDEWNTVDYQLSKKILKERGKEVNDTTIALLKAQRIKELTQPEESQTSWVFAGYLLAVFGGIIGIFIGWHLASFKKTLPNGERVFAHTPSDRRHGWRILIIGFIMVMTWTIIRVINDDW